VVVVFLFSMNEAFDESLMVWEQKILQLKLDNLTDYVK